jgi:hypothetical protein
MIGNGKINDEPYSPSRKSHCFSTKVYSQNGPNEPPEFVT